MTAALEMALLEELVESNRTLVKKVAALELVVAAPAPPLSMLPKSIHRRNCERRQADAVRGDRSGDGLSKIPASVRHREWRRRQAAAKKARFDPDRSPSLDLQPVNTEKRTAGGVLRTDRTPMGEHAAVPTPTPLAGVVAHLVDRASGYAESTRKRDRAWLFEEARRIWNEDLGLAIPSQWTGPIDWGACRALVRDWDREVLLKAVLEGGRAWKLAPGKWSRPTLGLVLHRLRLAPAATVPTSAPRPDPQRLTGEQLEQRGREKARAAAAPAKPALELSLGVNVLEQLHSTNESRPVPSTELVPPPAAPAGPLQLAEPSPSSSALAREVLELVNKTAARCRAFRGPP